MSLTKFPNGIEGFVVPEGAEVKTGNFTVTVNTDSGKTYYITASASVTLPALTIGNTFTFVNAAGDGKAQIQLVVASGDGISWIGSATDDKDLINTLATAKKGDYVTIAALDQTVAWQVTAAQGTWAKEA